MTPVTPPHRAAAESSGRRARGLRVSCSKFRSRNVGCAPDSNPSTADRSPSSSRPGMPRRGSGPGPRIPKHHTGRSWRGSTCEYDSGIQSDDAVGDALDDVPRLLRFSTSRRRVSSRLRPNALNACESLATSSWPVDGHILHGLPAGQGRDALGQLAEWLADGPVNEHRDQNDEDQGDGKPTSRERRSARAPGLPGSPAGSW